MAEEVNEERLARADAEHRVRGQSGKDRQAEGDDREGAGARAVVAGSSIMDLEFVRGLIEAVDQSGIDSLEISRGGTRIRVSKSPPIPAVVTASPVASPPVPVGPAAAEPATAGEPPPAQPAAPEKELFEVRSPMVGTFYRAPAPEAPPYVEPGSTVTKGQTLCILEAMKLMNELQSEIDGVVREVLVENSEPVEYGQVLFRIEPTG